MLAKCLEKEEKQNSLVNKHASLYFKEHGDLCDDVIRIFTQQDKVYHLLNELYDITSALIMVETDHIRLELESCNRMFIQNVRGFSAEVTSTGMAKQITLICIYD